MPIQGIYTRDVRVDLNVEQTVATRFRVGDKVQAQMDTDYMYRVTNNGWKGVVTAIVSPTLMEVEGLDNSGATFRTVVEQQHFNRLGCEAKQRRSDG